MTINAWVNIVIKGSVLYAIMKDFKDYALQVNVQHMANAQQDSAF